MQFLHSKGKSMRYDHLKTFTGAQARHCQNCEVALITGKVHVFKTAECFLCLKNGALREGGTVGDVQEF